MNGEAELLLTNALAVAEHSLPVLPGDGDALVVPPLYSDNLPATDTLQAVATLYLHAELELAAVLPCVEALAAERVNLPISPALDGLLERYLEQARRGLSRPERQALFARLFGLGGATSLRDAANHGFMGNLTALCAALVQIDDDVRQAKGPRVATEERVRSALERLLIGLVAFAYGGLGAWASSLNVLLGAALEVLRHPDLEGLVGGHGLTGVVRALTGGAAVDLTVALARAQPGHRLLLSCTRFAPRLRTPGPIAELGDPAIADAARWLAAYGLTTKAPA